MTIYPNFGPWIKAVDRGPVSRRGLCLQERELSSRVLHFTRVGKVLECRECTAEGDKKDMAFEGAGGAKQGSALVKFECYG